MTGRYRYPDRLIRGAPRFKCDLTPRCCEPFNLVVPAPVRRFEVAVEADVWPRAYDDDAGRISPGRRILL